MRVDTENHEMPKKSAEERRQLTLPKTFTPNFLTDADGRCHLVKEIKRRYKALKADTASDSFQKDMLCRRAIFIGIQLETLETKAADGESIDIGVYTQMVNSLMGILRALGLEKQVSKTIDLKAYVETGRPGRPKAYVNGRQVSR